MFDKLIHHTLYQLECSDNYTLVILENERLEVILNNSVLSDWFTPQEIQEIRSKGRLIERVSARLAAKIAIHQNHTSLTPHHIEIRSEQSGQPQVYIEGCPYARGVISLSHTRNFGAAYFFITN
ncbi:phosphopantetheinyl transferase (holo-ACP synthase) [Paenibacillus shirakamiensis]|uniref:Phosphopantetheinyl transferase (Holo-ACP synthase) n=1 Tax=Paenibacillus shirakamiensis TaxID=1265935 RepID=A0ABS4JFG4_9BACL|nr:hypothetical protein [Paenibacillus shirakamiensis]MBP2000450.1 phosphopantetheinyl transferase (holo-ACP synthase) [Paenibacillus shirakamiensis]